VCICVCVCQIYCKSRLKDLRGQDLSYKLVLLELTQPHTHTHAHAHTHSFNGPLSRTTRVSRYQKGKTNLDLLKQETVSGSGISWAICKSAPHSRQITMPALHPTTEMMPFLPPSQQRQSTEGMNLASCCYLSCCQFVSSDC